MTHPGPTLSDRTGTSRIAKLEERLGIIDDQIAESLDKRYCIKHEIAQIRKKEGMWPGARAFIGWLCGKNGKGI